MIDMREAAAHMAHLIGFSIEIDGQEWIVVAPVEWSKNYVVLENEDERTIIRPLALIQQRYQSERT